MKFNFYECARGARQNALDTWKRVYDKTKLNNIDYEELLNAMQLLNAVDAEILMTTNLTSQEKTKLFKENIGNI